MFSESSSMVETNAHRLKANLIHHQEKAANLSVLLMSNNSAHEVDVPRIAVEKVGAEEKSLILKKAFHLYLKKDGSLSRSLLSSAFPSDPGILYDPILSEAVVGLSSELCDETPSTDTRRAEVGSLSSSTPSTASAIIVKQLEEKLTSHRLLVDFLKKSRLWERLGPVELRGSSVHSHTVLHQHSYYAQNLLRESGALQKLLELFRTSFPLYLINTYSDCMELLLPFKSLDLWLSVTKVLCLSVNSPRNDLNQKDCAKLMGETVHILEHSSNCRVIKACIGFLTFSMTENEEVTGKFVASGGLQTLKSKLVSETEQLKAANDRTKGNFTTTLAAIVNLIDTCIHGNNSAQEQAAKVGLFSDLLKLFIVCPVEDTFLTMGIVITLARFLEPGNETAKNLVLNGKGYLLGAIQRIAKTTANDEDLVAAISYLVKVYTSTAQALVETLDNRLENSVSVRPSTELTGSTGSQSQLEAHASSSSAESQPEKSSLGDNNWLHCPSFETSPPTNPNIRPARASTPCATCTVLPEFDLNTTMTLIPAKKKNPTPDRPLCRGCSSTCEEENLLNSRNFVKTLTNDFNLCSFHRFVCQSLVKSLKRNNSERDDVEAASSSLDCPVAGSNGETPTGASRGSVTHSVLSSIGSTRSIRQDSPTRDSNEPALPFALSEDRRLRRGVNRYGLGSWDDILKAYLFAPSRTVQDLEDRWLELRFEYNTRATI